MEVMKRDTAFEWLNHEIPRLTDGPAFFAVDDSEVLISGMPHTLLAALSFDEPAKIVDKLAELRANLDLGMEFEFKWNQRGLASDVRAKIAVELRAALWNSFGLLTIVEGQDRQRAAGYLAEQIADLVEGDVVPFVTFDENIVRDHRAFRSFLLESGRQPMQRMQFSTARSFAHDLVQCADVFAGFQNLSIRVVLGDAKDRLVPGDFEGEELSLSFLLEASFRYVLWGRNTVKVDPDWTSEEAPPPDWLYKETEGLGLRIHSTMPAETERLLYDNLGRPYMGCLH
jgi:hypothetical protein